MFCFFKKRNKSNIRVFLTNALIFNQGILFFKKVFCIFTEVILKKKIYYKMIKPLEVQLKHFDNIGSLLIKKEYHKFSQLPNYNKLTEFIIYIIDKWFYYDIETMSFYEIVAYNGKFDESFKEDLPNHLIFDDKEKDYLLEMDNKGNLYIHDGTVVVYSPQSIFNSNDVKQLLISLADDIDNAYRPYTKNNILGDEIVENFIKKYIK